VGGPRGSSPASYPTCVRPGAKRDVVAPEVPSVGDLLLEEKQNRMGSKGVLPSWKRKQNMVGVRPVYRFLRGLYAILICSQHTR
jgi:hypothetical protein